jgi:hypothetical protein
LEQIGAGVFQDQTTDILHINAELRVCSRSVARSNICINCATPSPSIAWSLGRAARKTSFLTCLQRFQSQNAKYRERTPSGSDTVCFHIGMICIPVLHPSASGALR